MKFKFVQKAPLPSVASRYHDGYVFPNESMLALKQHVAGMKLKKAGGICSGGEVPLTVLLPNCTGPVVAVDHSLHSLYAAMTKALMLEKLTTQELHKLLEPDQYAKQYAELEVAWKQFQKDLLAELPEALRPAFQKVANPYISLNSFQRYWMPPNLSVEELNTARERLENLTFVYGDLTALTKFGKFQVVYLSNAMEHTPKFGKGSLTLDKVRPTLFKRKPRVLFTTATAINLKRSGWTLKRGDSKDCGYAWQYFTATPEAKTEAGQ